MSELTGSEFAGLTKLRELYLHNNYLASKKTFNTRDTEHKLIAKLFIF